MYNVWFHVESELISKSLISIQHLTDGLFDIKVNRTLMC